MVTPPVFLQSAGPAASGAPRGIWGAFPFCRLLCAVVLCHATSAGSPLRLLCWHVPVLLVCVFLFSRRPLKVPGSASALVCLWSACGSKRFRLKPPVVTGQAVGTGRRQLRSRRRAVRKHDSDNAKRIHTVSALRIHVVGSNATFAQVSPFALSFLPFP